MSEDKFKMLKKCILKNKKHGLVSQGALRAMYSLKENQKIIRKIDKKAEIMKDPYTHVKVFENEDEEPFRLVP